MGLNWRKAKEDSLLKRASENRVELAKAYRDMEKRAKAARHLIPSKKKKKKGREVLKLTNKVKVKKVNPYKYSFGSRICIKCQIQKLPLNTKNKTCISCIKVGAITVTPKT